VPEFVRWSEEEVVGWLATAGLLAGRKVDSIASMSRRATSVLVTLEDGSALFLKKPRDDRREGDVLSMMSHELRGLEDLMPPLVHHDRASNVAVTAGLTGRRSMRDVCGWKPPGDGPLVRKVAEGLARLHAQSRSELAARGAPYPAHVTNPVPTFGGLSPADFARAPGARFPEFLGVVQEVDEALRSLRDSWRADCLVHGDFKDDNIMVGGSVDEPTVTFIDWEMAGWGDPLWDVGSMVGQFLYHWATSIQRGGGRELASLVRDATVPFALVRSSAAAFASTYAKEAGLSRSGDHFAKVMQLAGVFLLHRVQATLEIHCTLPPEAWSCLQVGKTLVADPARGANIVLGEGT
jgi:thiamine kinase-like enzyme